jgi:hypothetical protein
MGKLSEALPLRLPYQLRVYNDRLTFVQLAVQVVVVGGMFWLFLHSQKYLVRQKPTAYPNMWPSHTGTHRERYFKILKLSLGFHNDAEACGLTLKQHGTK